MVRHKRSCLCSSLIYVHSSADTDTPAMEVVSTTPRTQLSEAERHAFDKLEKSIAMSAYHDSNERSASSGCLKGTRKDQIEAIMKWIESAREKKPAFLVLGPAGSGKTSLLNNIAENCKSKGYYTKLPLPFLSFSHTLLGLLQATQQLCPVHLTRRQRPFF